MPYWIHSASVGDAESWTRLAAFDRATVEAMLGGAATDEDPMDLAARLVGWSAFYRGPGRGFAHEPSVRIGQRRIVVRQFGGLDI